MHASLPRSSGPPHQPTPPQTCLIPHIHRCHFVGDVLLASHDRCRCYQRGDSDDFDVADDAAGRGSFGPATITGSVGRQPPPLVRPAGQICEDALPRGGNRTKSSDCGRLRTRWPRTVAAGRTARSPLQRITGHCWEPAAAVGMGRRALWRGPWSIVEVAAKQVFSRGSMILPAHVGRTYEVHNGKR